MEQRNNEDEDSMNVDASSNSIFKKRSPFARRKDSKEKIDSSEIESFMKF